MKATAAVAIFASAGSASVVRLDHPSLRSGRVANARSTVKTPALGAVALSSGRYRHYGDTRCPCIGMDQLEGETIVALGNGTLQVSYPADLGARCEAWDDDHHPECKAGGADWCSQRWCYVDSCNCDLPVLPKMASYVPDARYRGKPVFFSYATCGGKDMWSGEVPEVGTAGCRCIGFDNIPGTIDIKLQSRGGEVSTVSYPAELGGTCQKWDEGLHPMCEGDSPPKWCKQRWCYVDPCSCSLQAPPKVTMYLPDAAFTGKSLYYSYETCGSVDHFTEKYNVEACVNQKTEEKCLSFKLKRGGNKCAWTGKACLGWEIVEHPLCKKIVESAGKGGKDVKKSGKEVEKSSKSGASRSHGLATAVLVAVAATLSK